MDIFYCVTTFNMSSSIKFSVQLYHKNTFFVNSSEVWPENNIRNGNFSSDCNYKKGLAFGIDENE